MKSFVKQFLHATSAFSVEACLAEDRAAAFLDWSRLERNLALRAAFSADCIVHLPVLHALVLPLVAAVLAPLGRRELLTRVELLFTIGERE